MTELQKPSHDVALARGSVAARTKEMVEWRIVVRGASKWSCLRGSLHPHVNLEASSVAVLRLCFNQGMAMQTFKFDVQGMTCGGCSGSVQRALSGLDGVSHVEVTLRPGSATVQVDPSRVTPSQIEARLASLGFEARAVATA